jgi:hypothetical protein
MFVPERRLFTTCPDAHHGNDDQTPDLFGLHGFDGVLGRFAFQRRIFIRCGTADGINDGVGSLNCAQHIAGHCCITDNYVIAAAR